MKYAILLNSEITEEHDNLIDAEQAYKEYVKEEGDTFDFYLVATLEKHEAPAIENGNDYPVGRHFNIDYIISDKDIEDADKKISIKERVELILKKGRIK